MTTIGESMGGDAYYPEEWEHRANPLIVTDSYEVTSWFAQGKAHQELDKFTDQFGDRKAFVAANLAIGLLEKAILSLGIERTTI